MTRKEFDEWRKHHLALFPGLIHFLARTFGEENHELANVMWEEWFKTLAPYELQDAIAGSRKLAADSAGERFDNYEKHHFIVAEICKERKLARMEWDALKSGTSCEYCDNVGAIVIKKDDGYQAAVRCLCTAGKRKFPFLRPFSPENDVRA